MGGCARLRSTGRPLGADEFIHQIERRLGRRLRPRKGGPKPHAVAPSGSWTWEWGKWVRCQRNCVIAVIASGQLDMGEVSP